MHAYYKSEDGALNQTTVVKIGNELFTALREPLYPTNEHVELLGWPDYKVDVYETGHGATFYIPTK